MTIPYPSRRNSLRYPDYDYAKPGAVFVTICTSGKQRLFGDVVDGRMDHTPAGAAAVAHWRAIPGRFSTVAIDAFVVMPDHMHGILLCGINPDIEDLKATVGAVVRWYKSSVVEAYRVGVSDSGWDLYDRHLWQRDYHDRIIRTAAAFAEYQRYIEGNPGQWWERHKDDP